MKRILFIMAIAAASFLTACEKDDDDSPTSTTSVNNTLTSGTWRVGYYYDTDHDETANFNGFVFTYSGGGTVAAVNSLFTVNGTWATGMDGSNVELLLNFTGAPLADFNELTEDWKVIERTDTKVRLQDGTSYLTFDKN